MSEDWCRPTFDRLVREGALEIGDGYRAKLHELGGSGPLFLRAGQLSDQGIHWAGCDRFRLEVAERVATKMGLPGDTFVTTKGNSIGRTGYVPDDAPEFVYSPHLSYWRSRESRLVPGFLRYWAKGPEFIGQLRAMAHGTDMAPYLSLVDQRSLRITLPPVARQIAIAEVLGALDDKIDTNAGISRLCWELARAQYERMTAEPQDVVPAGEVLDLVYGKAMPATRRVPGEVPVYGSGGIIGWHEESLVDGPGVVVGRKGTVGAVHWSQRPFFPIDTTFFARPRGDVPMSFIYFSLDSLGLDHMNFDSAVPGLNRTAALRRTVPTLGASRLQAFDARATALIETAESTSVETVALAHLREVLLPALLSGALRVRDAEMFVAEAL